MFPLQGMTRTVRGAIESALTATAEGATAPAQRAREAKLAEAVKRPRPVRPIRSSRFVAEALGVLSGSVERSEDPVAGVRVVYLTLAHKGLTKILEVLGPEANVDSSHSPNYLPVKSLRTLR